MSTIKRISFGTSSQFNQFMVPSQISQPQVQKQNANDFSKKNTDKTLKTVAYASSAAAVAAIALSVVSVVKSGKSKSLTKGASDLSDTLTKKFDEISATVRTEVSDLRAKSDFDAKIDQKFKEYIDGLKGLEKEVKGSSENQKSIESKIQEKSDYSVGWLKTLEKNINDINGKINKIINPERNLAKIDNFNLQQNVGPDGKRIMLSKGVVSEIQSAASKMINKETQIPKLEPNSTTWTLTAESLPEKEGGLGEVPVQIAKNMVKELGIKNILVRPMNEVPGVSSIIQKDGQWHYKFKELSIDVDKVAEFDMYAFRNGHSEKETIEVFYGKDPYFAFNRLMFRNKDFFEADGLYRDSQRVAEKERYAFFPKAVYEFMKIKLDPNSQTSYKILNSKVFDEIPAPDVLLLNDWHTAAMAGLTKLLAPVENSNKELSKVAANKIKNMNLVELIHCLDHQGIDWQHGSDILNTLYGKYAYDIYSNAFTSLEPAGLRNVHTTDGTLNLANIAACLANKLKPVSPTYAKECASDPNRGHALQHIMQVRFNTKTMVGQSNGWDRAVNDVSPENLVGFNNNLNRDKFTIIKDGIDSLEVTGTQRQLIREIFTDPNDKAKTRDFKYDNFDGMLKSLRDLGIPQLNEFLDKMVKEGYTTLRTFKPETHLDSIDTIMENRLYNKRQFLEYMRAMVDYNNTKGKLFNLAPEGVTDLSKINMDDLDNQIVFNCGTRFVGQKGIDILAETMTQVLKEWPEKYPGKPKPIFVVGGSDGEGGKWEKLMRDFKSKMGKDAETVPYMVGYTPNNIFHGGTDITLFPSHFEPDGSKWESLYKGTPVVATRVGGHVDSIQDGVNGFLTKRTVPEVGQSGYDYLGTMVYDFKEALYRSVDTFFDKPKYRQMVRAGIDGNESWLIKDKDGKIVGGALLKHLEDLGYNLDDFAMVANADARKAFEQSRIKPKN